MLKKMSIGPNWVLFPTPDMDGWKASLSTIEGVLPIAEHMTLMHEFIDDMEPKVEEFIQKNIPSWSNITELRKGTKPFLQKITEWEPFEILLPYQVKYLKKFPALHRILK